MFCFSLNFIVDIIILLYPDEKSNKLYVNFCIMKIYTKMFLLRAELASTLCAFIKVLKEKSVVLTFSINLDKDLRNYYKAVNYVIYEIADEFKASCIEPKRMLMHRGNICDSARTIESTGPSFFSRTLRAMSLKCKKEPKCFLHIISALNPKCTRCLIITILMRFISVG